MSWSQLGNGVAKTCNWRELVFTLPHIVLWEIFTTSWTHVYPSLSLCTRYPLIHTPVPKRQVEDKFELTWILTLYIYKWAISFRSFSLFQSPLGKSWRPTVELHHFLAQLALWLAAAPAGRECGKVLQSSSNWTRLHRFPALGQDKPNIAAAIRRFQTMVGQWWWCTRKRIVGEVQRWQVSAWVSPPLMAWKRLQVPGDTGWFGAGWKVLLLFPSLLRNGVLHSMLNWIFLINANYSTNRGYHDLSWQ